MNYVHKDEKILRASLNKVDKGSGLLAYQLEFLVIWVLKKMILQSRITFLVYKLRIIDQCTRSFLVPQLTTTISFTSGSVPSALEYYAYVS